ncbi:calpastatin isoform X15 [Canis lupus familiaris]|uniref:calpastatin isoform X15 n=1 Tax=Canis lupus familiaris TaxID=9615 RepID=UPI0006B3E4A6|nr:calpastatin isoform X15 [Canis lupus familiaris]|eukprot:XP_013967678.1 calpastatin isoform X15 [Canis lupus familiaris]
MSQPGQKPAASPRPRRAAAARDTQEHVSEKTSGSPSKSGEKKGADEKKARSLESSQPSRTHAGGTAPATKASASSASTSKSSSMNPTETKAAKTEPEKKSQSTKPKSLPKHASDMGSKHVHSEKAASRSSEQLTSEKSTKPKTKAQDSVSAGGESVVAGAAAAAASATAANKKKEKKSLTSAVPVESKPGKPPGKSDMDAALDDLVDTLGKPEETKEDNVPYTGPEISDPMTSTYIEELGKREVTLPPKYRELLAKKEGITVPPPDSSKPMGPNDAIDALSSDFTCSSPTDAGKKTKEEKSTGEEILKAQPARVTKSAASPQEKKRKVEEQDAMSDQALEALSASLGSRKPEPELDLSSIKEVDEAKAKEEKLKKCGEDEETVPSEYRLKPATDKDGKPLLPEPEEKSKPLSESELIDELSEDFNQPKSKGEQSKPTEKTEESQAAPLTPVSEAVPRTSMCSIQSAPPKPPTLEGMVPDDAVEALAGSLGKKEADPGDGKPVEDKVKEKAKEEDREKLGEKEETIPPDYRLEEVKDKDGKPLLPKVPKESLLPMSEDFLLDALSKDFAGSSNTSPLEFEEANLPAVISEVVSQTPAPTTHSAGLPPDTVQSDNKELDDALDQLSDSLGQRQPDPDENKPIEDKVKERAKAEHRDKLGERDDTIPPEYRHLLDNDEGKPGKPPAKKTKDSKKPEDDKDPIDALSGDFDSCPAPTEASENTAEDKAKRTAPSSKTPKNRGKAKDSAKAKQETSKPKADEKNTS